MGRNDFFISKQLINWYCVNRRDLPWRRSVDPYIIWISEIILQQTRVAQGMDYFLRFTGRFPDIKSLADAEEDEVLKFWQGLGYYSRARNLHTAAKTIMTDFAGVFPSTWQDVRSLKGIGDYTAAAILSFVWGQSYPVVDGNVFRVISRLLGVATPIDIGKGKKEFTALAAELLNPEHAAEHNQAIMEFGALQCTPQNPNCLECPLNDICIAYAKGMVNELPVKQNKTKTRNRYFHYFYIESGDNIWLNRRIERDIWQGLYELPILETTERAEFEDLQQQSGFRQLFPDSGDYTFTKVLQDVKHVLSHQIIYADFYKVKVPEVFMLPPPFISISLPELGNYAISRLVEKYFQK